MRQGDTIDIAITVTDNATGALVDADSLAIVVLSPLNVETQYAYPGANVTRLSIGTYRLRFNIAADAAIGIWFCSVISTDEGVTASGAGRYNVTSRFQ